MTGPFGDAEQDQQDRPYDTNGVGRECTGRAEQEYETD